MLIRLEWDDHKASLNWQLQRVKFEEAKEAFSDPNALDDYDKDHSIEEIRYNLIGMFSRRLLFVVYTEPQENVICIVSARKAEQKHQRLYES